MFVSPVASQLGKVFLPSDVIYRSNGSDGQDIFAKFIFTMSRQYVRLWNMPVKKLIKTILSEKQWTAYRLGQETGISKQMISHWTRYGASSIAIRHLLALQRASGMSVSQFWKLLESEYSTDD